ncbi:hypothetical protein [Rhodobacter sp. SGA-6-6]|uniref:hypothetical protein n=1 Tax=Rhodobacter sp. SGA-6-6 TaxID=2710882 RepID=UPI00197FE1B0|nr:hypothetical protein [Rhodobacter sp. SGA-6-6]
MNDDSGETGREGSGESTAAEGTVLRGIIGIGASALKTWNLARLIGEMAGRLD